MIWSTPPELSQRAIDSTSGTPIMGNNNFGLEQLRGRNLVAKPPASIKPLNSILCNSWAFDSLVPYIVFRAGHRIVWNYRCLRATGSRISWKVDPDGQNRTVILSLSDYWILSHTRYHERSVEDRIYRGRRNPSSGSDNCRRNQPSVANEICDLV